MAFPGHSLLPSSDHHSCGSGDSTAGRERPENVFLFRLIKKDSIFPISRSCWGNCDSELPAHPRLITRPAHGQPSESPKVDGRRVSKARICFLFCLLLGTGVLCCAHQHGCLRKMWLSGHRAKELTQASLFSPQQCLVLAFGVGRPSRAPLVTGVGAHVVSLEAGMSEGPEVAPTSGPIVSPPAPPRCGGAAEGQLRGDRWVMEPRRVCRVGLH